LAAKSRLSPVCVYGAGVSQEASKTVETVLNMQPRVSATVGDGAPSADTLVSQMAAAIRAKLPKPLRREDAGRRTFSDAAGALGTVLAQEMDRFNRLLTTMDRTLQQLGAAIQGLVVMSNDLEVMYTGLLNNQVPQAWHAVAYLSLKPLASWVTDFHRKFKFMRMWLTNGSPRSFWLPGFFFPQVNPTRPAP
jgi:dynein heavy chain